MPPGESLSNDELARINRLAIIARFVGGLAHELNNSLQVIGGLVELLGDRSDLPPDVLLRIQRIGGQAEKASASIRRVVAFSRDTPSDRHRVDLSMAASEAVALRHYPLARAGISVAIDGPDPGICVVRAEPKQIRQLLLNLLLNAEEAVLGEHERRVRIAVERAGDHVLARVEDNGPGVPAEAAERIFEPFYTTRTSGRVLGLGLTVAQAIALAHGGQLTLEPSPRGARFLLQLPAAS